MFLHVIFRTLQAILVVLAVSFVVFIMNYFGGGDPVYVMLPLQATQADIEAMRQALGLDKPLVVQYGIYMSHLLEGDMGNSWTQGRPVVDVFSLIFAHVYLSHVDALHINYHMGNMWRAGQ